MRLDQEDGIIKALELVGPPAHAIDIALCDRSGAYLAESDVEIDEDFPELVRRHLLELKHREGGVALGDIAAVAKRIPWNASHALSRIGVGPPGHTGVDRVIAGTARVDAIHHDYLS